MLSVTLLGTGGPIPDSQRAGPATLVTGGSEQYLLDAGRGVLMRLAAAGARGTKTPTGPWPRSTSAVLSKSATTSTASRSDGGTPAG